MVKTLYLRNTIGWFGNKTGYEQLVKYTKGEVSVVNLHRGFVLSKVGSLIAIIAGWPREGPQSLANFEFLCRRRLMSTDCSHLLYAELNLELLVCFESVPRDIVATLHLPRKQWQQRQIELLGRLNSAILLYQRDLEFFEGHVGKGRVKFIHYGVDIEFFTPAEHPRNTLPRVLFSGVYLRNESMLVRLISRLHIQRPDLQFDLLVPKHHRGSDSLKPLLDHPAVTWHAGLSDRELRDLYQRSTMMLLPMKDSGANTAVVEAMASGLPVVTTDVGGIRDYGGGELYPVFADNDDQNMLDYVNELLDDEIRRIELSKSVREFAVKNLAWPLIAEKHIVAYQELCG